MALLCAVFGDGGAKEGVGKKNGGKMGRKNGGKGEQGSTSRMCELASISNYWEISKQGR